MSRKWQVRLGRQAERDFIEILRWTTQTFGESQARTHAETISLAIEALGRGPDVVGAKVRDDIQPGIRSLHVARQGRAGRHLVVFRAARSKIDVLRLLHESMDLPRHLQAANDHPT